MVYPADTIWFVRATDVSGLDISEGSAVAIRLQQTGKPTTARSYLLTAGHVLRGTSTDGEPGCGPVLAKIQVWAPGTSGEDEQGHPAVVKIIDLSTGDVAATERANTANDWAVLEIQDGQSAAAATTVSEWSTASSSDQFRVYGYTGGEGSFLQGVVTPTLSPDLFTFRQDFQGELILNGSGTRPGISGGGVFTEAQKHLVGIHRAREDDKLILRAVSTKQITRRLSELGFEISLLGRIGSNASGNSPPISTTPVGHDYVPVVPSPSEPWWIAVQSFFIKNYRLVGGLLLIAIVLLIVRQPPEIPKFDKFNKAVPGDVGAADPSDFDQLEQSYRSCVYYVLTKPFESKIDNRKFLFYSSATGRQIEVRGIIEDAATGVLRGKLIIDPAGKASDKVQLSSQLRTFQKGDRLRLLLGVPHANEDDAKFDHTGFLKTLKLE